MKGEDGCDLIVVGQRVLIAGQFQPAAIFVEKGKIVAIKTPEEVPNTPNGVLILRLQPHQVLLPGLVDSHVHVNDPGRNHWEDFAHATQSAAWGGVTTIADMPLNSIPPTTTVANFQKKLNATEGKLWIDVCFIGGVVQGNPDDVLPLLETGVKGFKCFLINSGVDEFVHVELEDLEKALAVLSGAKPASPFLMYHAEMELTDEELLQQSKKQGGDPLDYTTFLESRPQAMENKAIQLVIDMCRKYGVRSHIVHLSSSSALPLIKKAKEEGLPLTVETCYHYLTFSSENIPRGEPKFKCCPPIRETDNNAELWEGLKQGLIDLVVSDHSPCTAELKTKGGGDYLESWGGISSLQFGLAVLHTEAVIKRGLPLAKVISWLSESPAKLLGIQDQKGSIAVGHDADLVVFDPNETFEIKQDMILHKNKLTAYEGMKLVGRVKKTILRGKVIFDQESFIQDGFPHGKTLLK